MNKIITTSTLLGIISLIFTSCTPHGTCISGEINGAEGATIYLNRLVDKRLVPTDSATISDAGLFEIFPAQALEKDLYWLSIGEAYALILTDSTECLHLHSSLEDFGSTGEVEGSVNSALILRYYEGLIPLEDKYRAEKAISDAQSIAPESNPALLDIYTEIEDYNKHFIEENLPSPATIVALSGVDLQRNKSLHEQVLSQIKGEFGHTQHYKMMARQLSSNNKPANRKNRADNFPPGTTPPDITMNDPSGQLRSLSDLRGKVVLVDFWASWCGPCRRENPNVIQAYNKYHADGFEVFSVSLDQNTERWVDAIDKDKLIWDNHVSDLKGWQNEAAMAYGVHSIPYTMLLDRDGNVIATHLRGKALDNELSLIFGH